MQRIRRIATLLLAMLMLLSCNVTGFAAKKPNVSSKVYYNSLSIKRGGTLKLKFIVNCNSYTVKNGKYRTVFYTELHYKPTGRLCSNGCRIAGISGRQYVNVSYRMASNTATGKYQVFNEAFIHKTGTRNTSKTNINNWKQANATRVVTFTVK